MDGVRGGDWLCRRWWPWLVSSVGHVLSLLMLIDPRPDLARRAPPASLSVRLADTTSLAPAAPAPVTRTDAAATHPAMKWPAAENPLSRSVAEEPASVEAAAGTTEGAGATEAIAASVPPPLVPPRFDVAYLINPKPQYPPAARAMGEQGLVSLRVFVSARGEPRELQVNTSSGHARLDRAALDAVRNWRFEPVCQGDQAIAAWVIVPISFALRQ